MTPIQWRISTETQALANDPRYSEYDVYGAIQKGIEGWNDVFGYTVLQAVPATADDEVSDDEKNFLFIDPNPASGLAFANWRNNPVTGEIRGASVYLSNAFLDGAASTFTDGADAGAAPQCAEADRRCAVDFSYTPTDATTSTAEVRGDFTATGWTHGVPMSLIGGVFHASVSVPWNAPVQYKFLLNGTKWVVDPANAQTVTTGGNTNSLLAATTCAATYLCAASTAPVAATTDGGATSGPTNATALQLSWAAMPTQRLCELKVANAATLNTAGAALDDTLTKKQKVEAYMTHTVMHEIGHTLGLRHNFKGSLGQTSVMDYPLQQDAVALTAPGAYDVDAHPLSVRHVGDASRAVVLHGRRRRQ